MPLLPLLSSPPASAYRTAVMADSPIAYWRLGDSSGTLIDEIGNYNATATGITYGEPSLLAADSDTCIKLPGTSSYAEQDGVQAVFNGATEATLEAWVKRNTSSDRVLVGFSTTGLFRFEFLLDTDGNLWTVVENGGAAAAYGYAGLSGTGSHHVAMVYDASLSGFNRIKLYVDGSEVALNHEFSNAVPAALASDLGPFYFGREVNNGQWSSGWADEVAIYDTALSATRALAHYNAGMGMDGGGGVFRGTAGRRGRMA